MLMYVLKDMTKRVPLIEELLSEKYTGDRLLDWPNSFHVAKKFPSEKIHQWLTKTRANHEERMIQEATGTVEEYPIDFDWEGKRLDGNYQV